MKKVLSMLLALAMLAALAACGGGSVPADAADSTGTADSAGSADDAGAEAAPEPTPEPTPEPMALAGVTMETQVLADENGVKLTVSDWSYEEDEIPGSDPALYCSYTLTVENNSGRSLTMCRVESASSISSAVPTLLNGQSVGLFAAPHDWQPDNGGSLDPWLANYTIPDGESRAFDFSLSKTLCPLDEHDPWLPVQLRQTYALYDSAEADLDHYGAQPYLTVDAEIVTSARGAYDVELADAGDVLYENDLVTVCAGRFYHDDEPDAVESDWDYYFLDLYVHSKSDTMCNVALKDFAFNGAAQESFYAVSGCVYAGSTFCIEPTIPSADMEAVGITGLDGIESFHGMVEISDGENVLASVPVDLDSAWFQSHSSSYTQEHPES